MTRETLTGPSAPEPAGLSDQLRWQLRAMRRDELPADDLWTAISPRLEPRVAALQAPRAPWLALAASLLLVVGIAGMWRGQWVETGATPAALSEAQHLSSEYRQALEALPVGAGSHSQAFRPALAELDRSADQIRRALARDPDSQLLLEQLRRTYTRRLELSQRALVG